MQENGEHVPAAGAVAAQHGEGLRAAGERRDGEQHVVHHPHEEDQQRQRQEDTCGLHERGAGLRRARDGQQQVVRTELLDALRQSVPFEEGRKQRLDVGGRLARTEFEISRERVAAVPAHVETAGEGVEGDQGVEAPEVGVAGRIAEDSHNRAGRGVLVQDDLPDRVALAEDRAGKRLREHQLVASRERGHVALYESEVEHAEEHGIDGHDSCVVCMVVPAKFLFEIASQSRCCFDGRDLLLKGRTQRGDHRRGDVALVVEIPDLIDTRDVWVETVEGQHIIHIREDHDAYGQRQRQRNEPGEVAAARFEEISECKENVVHGVGHWVSF